MDFMWSLLEQQGPDRDNLISNAVIFDRAGEGEGRRRDVYARHFTRSGIDDELWGAR